MYQNREHFARNSSVINGPFAGGSSLIGGSCIFNTCYKEQADQVVRITLHTSSKNYLWTGKLCGIEIHLQYVKCLKLLNWTELKLNESKIYTPHTQCVSMIYALVCALSVSDVYIIYSHCSIYINDLSNHFSCYNSIFTTTHIAFIRCHEGNKPKAYTFFPPST